MENTELFGSNVALSEELFPGVGCGKGLNDSIGLALSRLEPPSEEIQDLLDYSNLPAWSPDSMFEFFNLSSATTQVKIVLPEEDQTTGFSEKITDSLDTPPVAIRAVLTAAINKTVSSSSKAQKRKSVSSSGSDDPKKRKTSKEYKCPICERVFQKKYNLDTHVKTHDKNRVKNFSCTNCNMSFDRKSHLNRHITTVHQQRKEHIFGHCGSQYTRSENLRKHVEKNHANN